MYIKHLEMENFTVLHTLQLDFSRGINVFIGENGMGKTHVMKALYSASQATKPGISFPQKLVRVFRPDGFGLHRLVSRFSRASHGGHARIHVISDAAEMEMSFTNRTSKYTEAMLIGEDKWEMQGGNTESTFIPAKEILSNSRNLTAAVMRGNVEFDDTYIDIIAAASVDLSLGPDSAERKRYLKILHQITQGRVTTADERFYLKPGNHAKIEFNLVAEGIRKIALLWQLIKNGTLEKGAILFWDEPEANINPKYIPVLADMLLELQRNQVQIFISTHDYVLAKYLEIKQQKTDALQYHSFYLENGEVHCEKGAFSELEHNAIMEAFSKLMDDVYSITTGGNHG